MRGKRAGGVENTGTFLEVLKCSFRDARKYKKFCGRLPHNIRALADRGEVVIRHPVDNTEMLLSRAARTDGRILVVLDSNQHLVAIVLCPAEVVVAVVHWHGAR